MTNRSRTPQHLGIWGMLRAASLAVVVLVSSGCSGGPEAAPPVAEASWAARPSPTESAIPSAAPTPVAALPPVAVRIPAIDLAVPLIDLGITAEGAMEVPADYDEVGWFTGGGRPGGFGPTVIAGHVDSPTGPAVFVRLGELAVGDVVEVTDAGGTVFRYVVTAVADYPKAAFPTHEVFGAVASDELRLITCGGIFDPGAASYVDNRVVYAVREGADW